MLRAKVKEWVSTLQLVCPYCNAVQTNTTAIHVMHSPPEYWNCEECNKKMKVWTKWDRLKEKIKRRMRNV